MALTVTATVSGAEAVDFTGMKVDVLNNASYTQNGATANSIVATTPQLAITPHATGNMIYAAVTTGATSGGFSSPNANTTSLLNQPQTGAGAWTVGAYRSTSTTASTSSTTYGFTAPTEASGTILVAEVEIVANGSINVDGTSPVSVFTTTSLSVTTASFTPPGAAVLVACVSTPWATNGTVNIAVTDSASAYNWSQLVTAAISGGNLAAVWVGIPKNPPVTTVATPPRLRAPGRLAPSAITPLMPSLPYPPAAPVLQGAGGLSGSGTIGATATITAPGAAGFSGSGTMGATGTVGGAQLSGQGDLTASPSGLFRQFANLSGSGSFTAAPTETIVNFAALSGSGTLGAQRHVTWPGFVALSGSGTMSIPQVVGGLVSGVGGVSQPQALPGSSQVAVAPPGSTNWQWLGTIGRMTALKYSFVCPGGCDKMSCTIQAPAAYRTQLFNPGWQVKITRGGHDIWHGKLDEPQYQQGTGWSLTAVGQGNRGQDFTAQYTSTWPASEPDQSINNAIGRGLPWVNPGVGSPSGMWLGQSVDSGAQSITALLNLVCTRGGLTWYVNSQPGGSLIGDTLSVFTLPTVVNRLLVVTTPVARTLGGDINTIVIRYQVTADNATAGTSATFAVTTAQNAQDVAEHQVTETYIDLSDAGVMTAGAAQAVGNQVLAIYQRASFAGPFTGNYGMLLNPGGAPVDPGADQAGNVVRLILTDFGYGGEVLPQFPITLIVGAYEWDDFAQQFTITPYQNVDQSLTGLLSQANANLTPVAAAST